VSDHIPDVTKMIGETPRTNLEAFFPHESMYQVCDADFTRRLERELNAANDRIKRLEEAGDELEYASVISEAGEDPNGFEKLLIAQREWRKAKEDKL
jgi:hypothetical protein